MTISRLQSKDTTSNPMCKNNSHFKYNLKNNFENDVDKMMCHNINNVTIKLFYNDSKMTINHLI